MIQPSAEPEPGREPAGGAVPALPASDLFLGSAAILLVVVALISAGMGELVRAARDRVAREAPGPAATREAAAELARTRGRAVILAQRDGVLVLAPSAPPLTIARDALPDMGGPGPWPAGDTPLVVIAADSGDTAFLLEAALARAGIAAIDRVRLVGDCAALEAVAGGLACRAAP